MLNNYDVTACKVKYLYWEYKEWNDKQLAASYRQCLSISLTGVTVFNINYVWSNNIVVVAARVGLIRHAPEPNLSGFETDKLLFQQVATIRVFYSRNMTYWQYSVAVCKWYIQLLTHLGLIGLCADLRNAKNQGWRC